MPYIILKMIKLLRQKMLIRVQQPWYGTERTKLRKQKINLEILTYDEEVSNNAKSLITITLNTSVNIHKKEDGCL